MEIEMKKINFYIDRYKSVEKKNIYIYWRALLLWQSANASDHLQLPFQYQIIDGPTDYNKVLTAFSLHRDALTVYSININKICVQDQSKPEDMHMQSVENEKKRQTKTKQQQQPTSNC